MISPLFFFLNNIYSLTPCPPPVLSNLVVSNNFNFDSSKRKVSFSVFVIFFILKQKNYSTKILFISNFQAKKLLFFSSSSSNKQQLISYHSTYVIYECYVVFYVLNLILKKIRFYFFVFVYFPLSLSLSTTTTKIILWN